MGALNSKSTRKRVNRFEQWIITATRSFTMTLAAPRGGGYPPRGLPTAAQLRGYVRHAGQKSRSRKTSLPTRKRPCSARTAATTAWSTACWTRWSEDRHLHRRRQHGLRRADLRCQRDEKAGRCGRQAHRLDHGRPLRRPGRLPGAGTQAAEKKGGFVWAAGCH